MPKAGNAKEGNAKEGNAKEGNGHGSQQPTDGRSMTAASPRSFLSRRSSFPLGRLRSEFDRLFDDFFRGWPAMSDFADQAESRWELDIEDQADKLVVHAEAPGFEPHDFDLKVQDNQLELCACQSEESTEEGGRHWHKQEFYRSIPLPSGIDSEHVDAQYRNGILTITLPKTEQSKARKIDVKA
jgi:HSP20 family protein